MTTETPPRAEIETRSAAVANVRHPERMIDLVVVPYNEWAPVEYKGRWIEEAFQPGAFGHIQNRAHRFLVAMEHDMNRIMGRCQTLDPDRPEGLVAEVRIRRGDEGDQVLDDAEDGMVGASVGFGVLPEHQHWETRSRRRIMKAFLDHVGLTFTPVYAGAEVLAVRSRTGFPPPAFPPPPPVLPGTNERVLTPNLDKIMLDRLEASYSRH